MNAVPQAVPESFPDYAKDTKINAVNVLTPEGAPGLSQEEIDGVALASAYASRSAGTVRWALSRSALSPERATAAKAAASIMAMNNVYYRFLHLVEDAEYKTLPARLRMTVIGNPGVGKKEFELYALAVSAINGCGFCVASHAQKLAGTGLSKEAVQSAVRVASVVAAVAQTQFIESAGG